MDQKSLRKKRPSGSSRPPEGLSRSNTSTSNPPNPNANDDLPPARPRPKAKPVNPQVRKSRVEDRIKKRMSMRYNDGDPRASAYRGSAAGVPDVPALPGGSRGTRVLSEREMVRADPRAVDIDILQQDGFDPDACEWPTFRTKRDI